MQWQVFFTLYAISLPIFFIVDLLWIGLVANNFYRNRIGHLMEINWPAAVVFYLIFLLGVTYFATYPAVQEGWRTALFVGALFGFFTYATYDLTNLATLKDWPLSLVVVDMIWGVLLGASVSAGTILVYSWFQ